MEERKYAFPRRISKYELKGFRESLGLTQKEIAELLAVSKPTYERWESGKTAVEGPAAILIHLLAEKMELLQKKTIAPREFGFRIYYMNGDSVCATIDVDEPRRRIRVVNYVDEIMYRPFGVNETPSYEEYEEFLESRCFPRTRDQMKLELARLDLPFYDPIMIIEKTQGRMADDDFWLQIER